MPREQRNNRRQQQESEFQERVVYIHRVSKVVKGGRRMSLVALVVVGDGKGTVGIGMGKSHQTHRHLKTHYWTCHCTPERRDPSPPTRTSTQASPTRKP